MAATRKEELESNFPEPAPDYYNDDDIDSPQSSNGGDFPPPPPPLTAEELATAVSEAYETQVANGVSPTAPDGENGTPPQIRPKPLFNPCVESKERQALHKELLLNYKIGKDVLQKPELNKVLRERRETQKKKEWEQHQANSRTSLEFKLEQRRHKEDEESKMNAIEEDDSATPEYLRWHKKITHKTSGESS